MTMNKMNQPIIEAQNLRCSFSIGKNGFFTKKHTIQAVRDVSFSIHKSEIFGLVGESGCGKTTTGKIILGLQDVTEGKIQFLGNDISNISAKQRNEFFKKAQLIFQDPFSALNPRMIVGKQMLEVMKVHNIGIPSDRRLRILDLFSAVGLPENAFSKLPHQLSGGQQQRVVIARALIMDPIFVVCDEPISSLDVSIQAQVINLLKDFQIRKDLTYLFISHDLKIVRFICDRIGVMYLGKLVEVAVKRELFLNPTHPYTRALIAAVPITNPSQRKNREIIKGEPPSLLKIPSGCSFHDRCPFAIDICEKIEPGLMEIEKNHFVACHRAEEI